MQVSPTGMAFRKDMLKLIGWIFSFGMSNQIVKQSRLSNQDKGNENKSFQNPLTLFKT